jgi:predicted NAD/FAD-binding protein
VPKLKIAVVGSGVSGLSSAWLLSQRHDVTLIEASDRLGGHANTASVQTPDGPVAVDTGFIVFNTWTYPNFTALMDYLDQSVVSTQMTFSVSAERGRYEYSGDHLGTLFGTARQWTSPQHWKMMWDLLRFYKKAETHAQHVPCGTSIGQYLQDYGYGQTFVNRHILPMAGAIWSAHPDEIAAYPFHAFIKFFANHKLFILGNRPDWKTVQGGSREYVKKLEEDAKFRVRLSSPVAAIKRHHGGVDISYRNGSTESFDQVVIATHGDTALKLLANPTDAEKELLQHFTTSPNRVYLHRDDALMPKTKRFWSGWNYRMPLGTGTERPEITYWMNSLQKLQSPLQHFVSLNPAKPPRAELTDGIYDYRHPVFNDATIEAQKDLWSLQGVDRVWFCGAWFGAGFHEDGLQSGLAVAEQLGGVRRPWDVKDESSRIHLGDAAAPLPFATAAE